MIRTARTRPLTAAALSLALATGLSLAGVAPAGAQVQPAGDASTQAAVTIPAPTTEFSGYGTEIEPTIDGFVTPDLTGIADTSDLRYEYQLDGTGPWLTEGTPPVRILGGPLVVPASAGAHLFSIRIAGTIDGVPVVGAATTPEPVRSSGFSRPYTPQVAVDGTRVTFSWDVREALNGNLPEDSQIFYELDRSGDFVFTGAVGSVTVDAGYDASVAIELTYGVVPDLWAYARAIGSTGSAPGSAALTSTPPPAILGRPSVGTTLAVRTGLWQPAPVRLAYQWYADGQPIPGATGGTFALSYDQIGARITVAVRGARDGYVSVTRTSAPTPRVPQPVITVGSPFVTGVAAVGRTVTARTGSWRPAPVTFAYAWLRDGRPIPGATASTYAITEDDRGRLLSVRVTGAYTQLSGVSRDAVSAGRRVG
ncbi:hypothetical protein DZG00_09275 [Clavibacter lycopersici]|uniref:Uncharacterized protein n=1 Tax=Clavibacter lycopersici TaxID=2301718 RepID=A0A399T8V6_9MICO|nr:hypothetical protein [Clavibacter lycopersici]RIJ51342.1 hypothetical protein DZG00_09275 [Clavibacter lycopersici]RIJ62047.1 hypothetical protein DZG02_03785 [Clavibacter lycopersici]